MSHAPIEDHQVSHAQFRVLANSMPTLAWMAQPDGWIFWYNRRWYDYTGTTPQEMAGWGWQSVHDPAFLPGVLERWTAAITTGKPFEMVFPLRGADGVFRPFLTRVEPLWENGILVGWFGNNTEITEQERSREQLQLMVNELNHRVKNTLATIQSIAGQTFATAPAEMRTAFEDRLVALSKVHEVLTRESWIKAELGEIVRVTLAYCGLDRFDVTGDDDVTLEARSASGLAMTLHELCTNAVKYGALSVPAGRVAVSWRVERPDYGPAMLHFDWVERDGPAVVEPECKGFGMRLIMRAPKSEKGSRVDLAFAPAGVRCTIVVPLGVDVLE